MVNCDQVFSVLTRGPFPSGAADDAAVEAHLASCADCARLAAALRPAIELFEEAVSPDEGRDLPSYWGAAALEPEPHITCAPAAQPKPSGRRRRALVKYSHVVSDLTSASVWRVAALVALGMFIGSVVRTIVPPELGGRPATSAAVASSPAAPSSSLAGSGLNGSGLAGGGPSGGKKIGDALDDDPQRRLLMEPFLEYHSDDSRDAWVRLPIVCLDETLPATLDPLSDHPPWVERQLRVAHCCTHCHNATAAGVESRSATAHVQVSCRHCHFN